MDKDKGSKDKGASKQPSLPIDDLPRSTKGARHASKKANRRGQAAMFIWIAQHKAGTVVLAAIPIILTAVGTFYAWRNSEIAESAGRARLTPGFPNIPSLRVSGALTIPVTNVGKATASDVFYHSCVHVQVMPLPDNLEIHHLEAHPHHSRIAIDPGEALGMKIDISMLSEEEITLVEQGKSSLYIYILIEYNDGFRAGRQRESCYVWIPDSKKWNLCENHQKAT